MIYLLISLIWAGVVLTIILTREKSDFSQHARALEELGKLIPGSINQMGLAIQRNLYPSLQFKPEVGGADNEPGQTDNSPSDMYEAFPGPILDWEEIGTVDS